MLTEELKYSYNDVALMPAIMSSIKSRSECNPFYNDVPVEFGDISQASMSLPIFTAPMDTVINQDNLAEFEKNRVIPILPRTIPIEDRLEFSKQGKWVAYSLAEFRQYFVDFSIKDGNIDDNIKFTEWHDMSFMTTKALIDVANGHMKEIYDLVTAAKDRAKCLNYKLKVMVGNIANPETYRLAASSGVDYIRVGIGGGAGCLTSTQTGVHYPIASLISEIAKIKREITTGLLSSGKKPYEISKALPKIVADGGVRGYSDVIKALALGADYVMCGSVFNKMWESAALFCTSNSKFPEGFKPNSTEEEKREFIQKHKGMPNLLKEFSGMSTKERQKMMNKKASTTSEGISKAQCVEYTMQQWTENFADYLKSAMSYTGYRDITDFIGNPSIILLSQQSSQAINK